MSTLHWAATQSRRNWAAQALWARTFLVLLTLHIFTNICLIVSGIIHQGIFYSKQCSSHLCVKKVIRNLDLGKPWSLDIFRDIGKSFWGLYFSPWSGHHRVVIFCSFVSLYFLTLSSHHLAWSWWLLVQMHFCLLNRYQVIFGVICIVTKLPCCIILIKNRLFFHVK